MATWCNIIQVGVNYFHTTLHLNVVYPAYTTANEQN